MLVLLPWNERLLAASTDSIDARVAAEIDYWRDVWHAAQAKGISRIVQIGFDWIGPGARGFHLTELPGGDVQIVRKANSELRRALPAGNYFVSLEEISGIDGRRAFYDLRSHFWTRQPFSQVGVVRLSAHIVAGIRAVTTGSKKVVVVDLDNTLWGGIVGEVGADGIVLGETPEGEAYLAFQRYLKGLAERGILLAVSSKNEAADAREPFTRHPCMILSLDAFAAFEANWSPKVESLRRIADRLALGLDSFVFFDDNPAEREHVRQALPQVQVVEVPEDPCEYVPALEQSLAFEVAVITEEDAQRRLYYADAARRFDAAAAAPSLESYLRSLDMKATIRDIDAKDFERVVQLIAKTNQFNLTTRRHAADDVRALLAIPNSIGVTLRLRDRFGDQGLVAVLLAHPSRDASAAARVLEVDTLLMSCRIIGRTAEHLLVNHLLSEARRRGFTSVRGHFIATAKNSQVKNFWTSMGFSPVSSHDMPESAESTFERSIIDPVTLESFVRLDD